MATLFELAARIQAAGGAEGTLLVLVKATLILAIARLLLAAMPRAAAATRHIIATAALIGVAVMPILTAVTPAWNIVIARSAPVEQSAVTPSPSASASASPSASKTIGVRGDEEASPSRLGTAITLAKATGVVPAEPLSAFERAMNVARSTWKGMIVVAIGIATLLMLVQMVVGMLGVWFVARKAEEVTHDAALLALDEVRDQVALGRDVRLLRSSRISVPVLWGVFRPVLLMPADVVTWPAERLRVVLLHELAHLKRFDGISLILTRVAVSIFWYHPLAWSLERAGRNDCERACDDLVLASGTKPSDYADHLLAIARSMPTFDPFRSVTLAMSRKSQLEGRLLSILQPHVARRIFSGKRVAVACAVAVACLIPISAMRLIAEPAKAKEPVKVTTAAPKTDANVTVTPDIEALQDYFVAKLGKYDKRIDRFAHDPENGQQWYERAYNLYNNDRFAEAAVAFRKAAAEGYRPATSLYNASCSYALMEDAANAADALRQAIDAGWDDIDKIADDSDFDAIRSDARFLRAVNDRTGEVATRRLNETLEKYSDLKAGRKQEIPEKIARIVGNFEFNFKNDDWSEVGTDLLRLRHFDESIDAFQHAIAAGQKPATSMYNIACVYSLKGDAARGMEWLEKSINEGFDGEEKMQNDPDLAFLRKQEGFDRLVALARDLELKRDRDEDDDDVREWAEVLAHHKAVTQKYPNLGRGWFNLGFAALQARDFDTALEGFQRAIDLGHRESTSSYNMACAYALSGNKDAAFQWLEKARDLGFELGHYLDHDDDLNRLHGDPRFNELRAEARSSWTAKHPAKHKNDND